MLESRAASSSVDPDMAKILVERAEKAEALVTTLKEELAESENVQSKLNLKIERMQSQIDKLKGVKQVRSGPVCPYDVNIKQEDDTMSNLLSNDDQRAETEIFPSPPFLTPSHSSSPSIPLRRSKRKEGPVPSLEHVALKKIKVSKPGGDRTKYRMSDLSGLEKLVVKDAQALVGIFVATEDAYPELSGRKDKLAKESWTKVSTKRQLQLEFTITAANLITLGSTRMRNRVKCAARSLVQTLYSITKNSPKLQTRKQVEKLLGRYNYIYKDPVKRTGIYRHPSIQTIINMTWFRNAADDGPTNAEFSDGGDGIPLSTIALTLAAIHCALDEWITGEREDVEFRNHVYQKHYTKHLDSLNELEEHTVEENIIPRLRKHWLKTALNFARAPELSMVPTGHPNTHLTTTDLEAAKSEWKDIDLDEDDI
ncbi:hypothetical protein H1R20_g6044, partial [Candolleomyces eurysporus]